MASEKARRENVEPAIHVTSVGEHNKEQSQKGKSHYKPVVIVGGLEFSSGSKGMQQQQKHSDTQLQRDKQSSHVDQGIRGEGLGSVKFASHGQAQKGPDTKKNTQMQKQEGEEGRVHGGVHPGETGKKGRNAPSSEETSQLKATAQPNSNKSLGAAEDRYDKSKEFGSSALRDAKESASHGLGAAGFYATAKGAQAKDTVSHGVRSGSQYVADKAVAVKDTALEKGAQAKDAIQVGSEYVADKAGVAKDTALEKGRQAYAATKDTLSSAGQTTMQTVQQAKDYTLQKAGETKDYTAEKSKNAAGYVGQKGVEAKDATVATGKSAVGYAGEAAGTAKDMAEVGALGAAHYTAKAAAAATKATAGVVSSAAGYAGDAAVATKDAVADAGTRAAGYAGDKLAAAKDYVVSAEESAADYSGKKKAEAERQLRGNAKRESGGGGVIRGEKQETGEGEESESKQVQQQGGGVLQAIGEAIVGIGKTTTDFVAGGNQSQTGEKGE